jgi:hypothetical protein
MAPPFGARDAPASDRWILPLAGLSFCLSALVPLFNHTRFGDLSDNFTDHLHHAHATWLFLHRGLDLYRLPMRDLWASVPYPHPTDQWGHMPMVYPPGVFAVFLPTALLGAAMKMSTPTFGAVGVLYTLLLAHLALAAVWRTLLELPATARPFAPFVAWLAWLVLVRLGVQGFFDPLWIGCGALCILALRRDRPDRALLWFAAAAFVHFRAAMLAPVALLALWRAVHGKAPRDWPWGPLAASALSCLLACGTFLLLYPATAAHRLAHPPVTAWLGTGLFWSVVAVSTAAVAGALLLRDGLLAATCALGSLFALLDFIGYLQFWHHASLLLAAPLLVGLAGPPERAGLLLQLSVGWMLSLQALVWGGAPTELLTLVAERLRPRW